MTTKLGKQRTKRFASWLSRNKHLLLLLLIIAVGVFLRVFAAYRGNATWDEGIYLLQASRVANGEVPHRGFLAIAPPYLYVFALWGKLFGFTLLSGRMLHLLCGTLIIPLIYLIGRDLVNSKVGLVAALALALSPPDIYFAKTVDFRQFYLLLVVLGVYFIQKSLKRNKTIWSVLGGICVAIATWTYVREATFILTVPVLYLIIFYLREGTLKPTLRLWWRHTAWFGFGVALFAVPFGLYLTFSSSFRWLTEIYISGGASSVGAGAKGIFLDAFFADPIDGKVVYTVVLQRLFLVVPSFIFFAWAMQDFLKRSVVGHLVISLIGVASFAVVIWGMGLPPCGWGTSHVSYPRIPFIYLFVLATVLAIPYLATPLPFSNGSSALRQRLLFIVVIWWSLTVLSGHAVNKHPLVSNFIDFAPVSALATGFVIVKLLEGKESSGQTMSTLHYGLANCFVALIVLCASLSGGMFYNRLTEDPDCRFSQSSIKEAARFLEERSEPADEVLTNVALVALEAKRKMFDNYDNFSLFGLDRKILIDNPFPYDPFDIIPSIEDIKQGMESGRIKFIISEASLKAMTEIDTGLGQSFKSHYYQEKTFGALEIYSWQPAVSRLCDHLGDVTAYSDSRELSFSNGQWKSKEGQLFIQRSTHVSTAVGGEVKSDQVFFHSDVYQLRGSSYIKFTVPGNPYAKLDTSYGLADGAMGKSDGVIYRVKISTDGGITWSELLVAKVHENVWTTQTVSLSKYKGFNVMFLLESNNIETPSADWFQVTFTLGSK